MLQVWVSEDQMRQIEALKKEFNTPASAQIIRIALTDMYRLYISGTHARAPKGVAGSSPFPVGRPRKNFGEDKKTMLLLEIAEALKGEIVDRNGNKAVIYKIYEKISAKRVEVFEQELPLSMMERKLIDSQYKPSREEVEKVLALKKK